ncbi:MAG: protein kinase, partial [Thermoanaerobaculia bacterium]|nr:protein kinase [Thermoanaerobaculia bacterium]
QNQDRTDLALTNRRSISVRTLVAAAESDSTLFEVPAAKRLGALSTGDGFTGAVRVGRYQLRVSIDQWCRDNEIGLRDRLRLFLMVCSAVQSAHQNLVVHRDLKPGNILVDSEGEPKLLDFGVAKLLDESRATQTTFPVLQTAPGASPLTPAYASPEQIAGGAVTTATDVYALGVLLYEMLCGRRPHEAQQEQHPLHLLVAIHSETPRRPSTQVARSGSQSIMGEVPRTLARRLRGDLDQIVMHALAKEPSRRYPTANQLDAGNYDAALEEAEASASVFANEDFGNAYLRVLDVLRARCLVRLGRSVEAEKILQKRLAHLDESGAKPKRLVPVLEALVEVRSAMGDDPREERERLRALSEPRSTESVR